MIQVQHTIAGELAACKCGRQPKHFETLGKGLHHLECPPCDLRTAKHESFQEAVAAWEQMHAAIAA